MKKNNRGITLIELLISVSLISIVVIFLFRLLIDVKSTYSDGDYNKSNQQKRALIIKTIEEDFIDNGLIGLKKDSSSNSTYLKLTFTFEKSANKGILEVNSDSISYTDSKGDKETWKLDNPTYNYQTKCLKYNYHNTSNYFYIMLSIPVIHGSSENNVIDDLELNYIGEYSSAMDSNFEITATSLLNC